MVYNYTVELECKNTKDQDTYGRQLYINDYDSALATFKMLVTHALDKLIDPYTVELRTIHRVMYKFEKRNE